MRVELVIFTLNVYLAQEHFVAYGLAESNTKLFNYLAQLHFPV